MVVSYRRGFTLLEALLTIAVMSGLSAVIFSEVNIPGVLARMRNAERRVHLNDLLGAIATYTVDADGTLPPQVILPPVPGPTTFTAAQTVATFDGARTIVAADFDQDTDLDVASGTEEGSGEVSVWLRSGAFPTVTWTKRVVDGAYRTWELAAGDIDGDGRIDLTGVSKNGKKVSWWRNLGGSPLTFGARVDIDGNYQDARVITLGNLDGDSDLDVMAASDQDKSVRWWENNGSPLTPEWTGRDIESSKKKITEVVAGDIDGDGDLDIVGGYKDDLSLWIHPVSATTSPWPRTDIDVTLKKTEGTALADMDGDTDRDVVAISKTGLVSYWINDGTPAGNDWAEVSVATNFGGQTVAVADFDGDGDLDIVGGSPGGDKVAWWENTGSGVFGPTGMIQSGSAVDGIYDLVPVDMEGDGDADIVAALKDGDRIVWWANQSINGTSQPAPSGEINPTPKPVCRGGISVAECDANGGVSLNVLIPNHIASIPVDPHASDLITTGFEVEIESGTPKLTVRAPLAELGETIELRGSVGTENCLVWDIISDERTCVLFE